MTRPKCQNCGSEMLLDPAPRRPLKAPQGEQQTNFLCSFCWKREAVAQATEVGL
ncbi:MAG: hypothetical protein WA695_01245 [Candidatus Dormiibacterota bacterium]